MSQSFMPSDGNGTPDFLSVINAEVNKVEPRVLALPAPSVEPQSPQSPVAQLTRPQMAPSDPPKEASHLKASTFKSRADELFFRFRQLLSQHYRTSRNVNFYADKLCITPRYLANIVQSHYGKSPKEAIDIYTIMQIRLDLL